MADGCIIEPTMVMTDRRGIEWRRATTYQETDRLRPGWMLLRSARGETMPFPEVISRFGKLVGPPGKLGIGLDVRHAP